MLVTVEGRQVFATTGGREFDPDSPAIVFVHGAGFDHTVWSLQTRYFAHHGRSVLAVDLPGHGRSEGPPLETVEQMARWLAGLLDTVGVHEAAVVGHSMGSLVALEFAAQYPDRARAIALLGTAPSMPVHPDLLAAADANDPLANELISDWALGVGAHLGGSTPPGMWMTGGSIRLLEAGPGGALATDLRASGSYAGATAAAERVSCPVLVLLGEDDRMTPAAAGRSLAALIGDAKVVVLEDCGHSMMVERPDATLDALQSTV